MRPRPGRYFPAGRGAPHTGIKGAGRATPQADPGGTIVVAAVTPARPDLDPISPPEDRIGARHLCHCRLHAGVSTHSHVRMPRRLSRVRYGEPGRSRLSVKGFATLSGPNWRPSCRQSRHPDRSIESPGHVVIAARLVSSAVSRSGHVITAATEEGPGRQ